MSYLIYSDYINRRIESSPLSQITSNNPGLIDLAQNEAIQIIKNKLFQKYDVKNDFQDTTIYDPLNVNYQPANRVYLNANPYDPNSTYLINVLTLWTDGNIYQSNQAITIAETWTPGHWNLVGSQYTLFYVGYPFPLFQMDSYYNIGDQVFWNGSIYTALNSSMSYDHEDYIQFESSYEVPPSNIFPDDKVSGAKFWANNWAYQVPAGSILNSLIWTQGDNRDQEVVGWALDITLYLMYLRKNIPMLADRKNSYIVAMAGLKDALRGDYTTLSLPLLQPDAGRRIRGVTNIKQINSY